MSSEFMYNREISAPKDIFWELYPGCSSAIASLSYYRILLLDVPACFRPDVPKGT